MKQPLVQCISSSCRIPQEKPIKQSFSALKLINVILKKHLLCNVWQVVMKGQLISSVLITKIKTELLFSRNEQAGILN